MQRLLTCDDGVPQSSGNRFWALSNIFETFVSRVGQGIQSTLGPHCNIRESEVASLYFVGLLLKKEATDRAEDGCSDTGNENLIFCKNPAILIHQYISHQLGMTPRLVILIICFEVGRFYFKITT